MNGNLLIVDDEPHLIGVLEFMLKGIARNIFPAENAQDALKILEGQEVHCVLCDMNLPRMNGIGLLREVREKGMNVPFIFFTAEENPEALEEAARLGAMDFLFKPHFDGLEKAIMAGLLSRPHAPLPGSSYGKVLSRLGLNGKIPVS